MQNTLVLDYSAILDDRRVLNHPLRLDISLDTVVGLGRRSQDPRTALLHGTEQFPRCADRKNIMAIVMGEELNLLLFRIENQMFRNDTAILKIDLIDRGLDLGMRQEAGQAFTAELSDAQLGDHALLVQ
ncbi:Exosome complex component rrp4 [Penicillium expansum]|nr:Exosome complex component rrp4 [Penicillium expansum]